MRKGPLALAEGKGLENVLHDLDELFKVHGERFRPAPLLKRYVRAGRKTVVDLNSRKTGKEAILSK
jgi:hypothetical protein